MAYLKKALYDGAQISKKVGFTIVAYYDGRGISKNIVFILPILVIVY
jgi:hypothetical protein